MTVPVPLPVEIIAQPAQLDAAVRAMGGSQAIALDTESNSFHHYPEQLCLIQIATRHNVHVIDTISLKELDLLNGVLADGSIQKVIHGADYDIRSLDRHHGSRIRNLYDTSVSARFAGIPEFGLAALTKNLLGVTIPKSKRLQRTDWGRRPLSADALDYAITDVLHLIALREILDRRLLALGRTAWVAEECSRLEDVRYIEPNIETGFFSIKGVGKLDGRGLAILRSLWLFRDKEARRQHRPPFFVLPDAALIYLVTSPMAALSEVPGLGQIGLQRFGRGLQQALQEGLTASPVHRPPPVAAERAGRQQTQRLSRLKAWRVSLGARLSLDPPLLWPTASLERIARTPDNLGIELNSPNVRRWQRDQFTSSLKAFVKTLT
jgi:ribonuclease D